MVYISDRNQIIKLNIDIIFGVEFVNKGRLTTRHENSSTFNLTATQLTDTCQVNQLSGNN